MRLSGRALVLAALDRDIALSDIAKAAGISKSTLYGIKSGRKCTDETAQKIAEALQVSVDELKE